LVGILATVPVPSLLLKIEKLMIIRLRLWPTMLDASVTGL